MMQWRKVKSSNVVALLYDPANAVLYTEFKGGGYYAYDDVLPGEYAALITAESVGSHLNRCFKGVKPYKRLDGAPEEVEGPSVCEHCAVLHNNGGPFCQQCADSLKSWDMCVCCGLKIGTYSPGCVAGKGE